jgi:MarR family 2-MHQ and catechol resistance regulon transcriptional repressor
MAASPADTVSAGGEAAGRRAFGITEPAVHEALAAYVKLLRASRAVVGSVEKLLAAHGLTTTQLGVLDAILHLGPVTQRDLGRKVLTSAGNMTDVVDKLEKRGLVRRQRDAADRRLVRVQLTEAGRRTIEELFPLHAADIARAMSGLPPDDLRRLGKLLRTLGMAAAQEADPGAPLGNDAAPP